MAVVAGGFVAPVTAQAVARRTLGELITDLTLAYDDSDTTIRRQGRVAIQGAIRKMNTMGAWDWEILGEEITIVADQADYALQAHFKRELDMHYLDSSGGRRDEPFTFYPYQKFLARHSLKEDAKAWSYTLKNVFESGVLTLFPRPSQADVAFIDYYRETPIPKQDHEPLEIPEYALAVIEDEAWYRLLRMMPAERRTSDIAFARDDARKAWSRIRAFLAVATDLSRITYQEIR